MELIFGKACADPWHRLTCCTRPVLLFVEFCQVQGPRTLFHFPERAINPHLSLEEVSLWLMSSENNHGTLSCSYNQQIGAHVLTQYGTLLDITARAFQRPFAIAYITPDRPSPELVRKFQLLCVRLIRPMLCCNHRYIRGLIGTILTLTEGGDRMKGVRSHMPNQNSTEGCANYVSFEVLSQKIRTIAEKALPLYNRLFDDEKSGGFYDSPLGCECDNGPEDLKKFINILAGRRILFTELVPILELAPCSGGLIKSGLKDVYTELRKLHRVSGLLFSGNVAVMRSFFGANAPMSSPAPNDEDDAEEEDEAEHSNSTKKKKIDTMKMLSHRMIRCLYPLLAGEKILIFAAHKRKLFGQDLLHKLNLISTRKMLEPVRWHCLNLSEQGNSLEVESTGRLVGVTCTNREDSVERQLSSPDNTDPPVIVDLNKHQIRCREYTGRFLHPLFGRKHLFASDKCLMQHIASVVCDCAQLAILAKYTSPHFVVRKLKLDLADQMILYNLLLELNVTKYSNLKLESHMKAKFVPQKQFKL